MQTQTSPVFTVNLCTGLCVIASFYNVQIVHKAQKSLAKWEINNVNRNALRWAAALECPTLTVVIPPFLFPKCFFKNMSAPLVLFLGSDSWWLCVRISSNISASLNSCGGCLCCRRGRRVFVVFCLIYSRPMTKIPHICDPLQHNTYKHKYTVVFAAGKINKAVRC